MMRNNTLLVIEGYLVDFTEITELLSSGKSGADLASKLQLNRIDIMLLAITEHLGLDIDFDQAVLKLVSNGVIDLLESGEEIKAIKLHRKETGAGLAEAKDIIDLVSKLK